MTIFIAWLGVAGADRRATKPPSQSIESFRQNHLYKRFKAKHYDGMELRGIVVAGESNVFCLCFHNCGLRLHAKREFAERTRGGSVALMAEQVQIYD